ncbi:retrovirus-related pol polyprotein from transposon TNT 1-94 [Tanacetum coccineum]
MLFTMPSWKQVNPPYKFKWTEKTVPVAEGSSKTTTEGYMENYKNVSQDIRDQLNAEAEAVQIILTGIDNNIYSTVDACPNACEMWKTIWFYKMMNELVRNQCDVTNHQVNIQFLLQLQPKWQRFVTLVKQSQELKTVSYYKLYDILKQHQNEVNEIRAERLARTANPLALVAQQQPVYHPQNHPTHYTHSSSTKSQQAATRNRGKATVNSSTPTYDQEHTMVADDDEMSKDKEIDKLIRANQDNTPRINRGTRYDNQRVVNVVGARENVGTPVVQQSEIQCYNCKEYGHVARECQKPKRAKDAAYHKEKMLLCKQEEAGFQLNAEQADWRDDTNDEPDDHELEAHYMYMAQIQEVSGLIFDVEPLQKEQGDNNITIDSLDMCYNREQDDHDDDDDDLAKERDLLASLIEKLKCEIDDSKNHQSFEASKTLICSIENLIRYHDVNYASKVAIDCAKAKGDLMSYKIESEKSSNEYTRKINDLNQMISDMKKQLFTHQETISIMSQEKEAQIKLYKTREDKELDKVIALENKVKKPEFLKKAQRENPHLYDIGCYNDNLALMLAPESDKMICLANESRSILSDLIKPFDYDQLNNLYDLFVPQREKSLEQQYFSKESIMSHTSANNEISKGSFHKQTTLLEKRMDESISWDQKCKSSKELFKIKRSVDTIFDGVERCKQTIAKRTYFGMDIANITRKEPKLDKNKHETERVEARKMTQERDRNSKTSVMPSARFQSTSNGSKPKPRSTNQSTRSLPISKSSCVMITTVPKADHSKSSSSFSDSKHFVCSTCHKRIFNANHDACITKLMKEVNSHAKIQSHKTINNNKPVDQKSHTQKPSRWIPTGKLFDSCTSKDDSEPTHGSNIDIPNIHESKQTLDLSIASYHNVNKSSYSIYDRVGKSIRSLFRHFNGENQVVSKSFAVITIDASNKRQQQPNSTSSTSTLATTVTADGNFNL